MFWNFIKRFLVLREIVKEVDNLLNNLLESTAPLNNFKIPCDSYY